MVFSLRSIWIFAFFELNAKSGLMITVFIFRVKYPFHWLNNCNYLWTFYIFKIDFLKSSFLFLSYFFSRQISKITGTPKISKCQFQKIWKLTWLIHTLPHTKMWSKTHLLILHFKLSKWCIIYINKYKYIQFTHKVNQHLETKQTGVETKKKIQHFT